MQRKIRYRLGIVLIALLWVSFLYLHSPPSLCAFQSYEICMPTIESVIEQEEEIVLPVGSENINPHSHQENMKLQYTPITHYFWLTFWILSICFLVALTFRLIKRKVQNT